MQHAFTVVYEGVARVLLTKVRVSIPQIASSDLSKVEFHEYFAIWDTGATHSAITKKVVSDLGIQPTGLVEVRHAKGKSETNTYLVQIGLPNNVNFNHVRVTEVDLIPDDNQGDDLQPQLLIGMDIIGAGDFAVSAHKGITCLSFRLPSSEKIDFVPRANMLNALEHKKNSPPFRGVKR